MIIVGSVILFSAGVFDEPVSNVVINQAPQEHFHNGADMSELAQINSLREQIEANPNDYHKMLELAHLLNDSGFYEEAIKWYDKYLGSHNNDADVYVDRGVCYYQLNQLDKAIDSMEKGIKINPQHQTAHFNLGVVNLAKNNIDAAISWWQKAIELNPNTDIANKSRELIQKNTNN